MTPSKLPLLLASLILGSPAVLDAALLRGPYLQMANPQAMTLRWRTDAAGTGVVRFGLTAEAFTSQVTESAAQANHEIRLTGLTPSTKYYYSVEVDGETLAGGEDYFFTTPPIVGSSSPFRFWALGDAGTQGAGQIAVRDSFAAVHTEKRADFLMMLGDNAYGVGTDLEYQGAFFNMYPNYLKQLCVWSCLGNHETYSNPGAPPYFDMFTFPTNGECGGVASGTEHYYSFDHGNVHFISLDFMQTSRLSSGTQANWLREDLENVQVPWIVVFFHHPPYTKGSHNSDWEWDLAQLRENFMPILENGGVDLVLSGHSHSYERSWLMRGHYGYSTSFNSAAHIVQEGDGREDGNGIYQKYLSGPNAGKGTVYIVAGSSGQTGVYALDHPAMYKSLGQLGSLVVDVSSHRMDVKFLNTGSTYSDYFTMQKSADGPLVLPGEPLNLAVLPAGPDSGLLRWDDVAAEMAYDIETSADGMTFTWLTSTGVNNNSATIPNLSNGNQIWLRVTARNPNGSTPSQILTYTHSTPAQTPQPLTTWRFVHFGNGADAGNGANLADPDGDGSTNLMEYATGTNPTHQTAPVVLRSQFDEEEGVYSYSFDRLARTDITYAVEASNDLTPAGWETLFTSTGAANTAGQIMVPDPAIGVSVRRFARLKISHP